jgi:hypothetical protein
MVHHYSFSNRSELVADQPFNLAGIITCEITQRNYSNHMSELLKIVAIGNSKGVRIPSAILRRQGIVNEVECLETLDGVLTGRRSPPGPKAPRPLARRFAPPEAAIDSAAAQLLYGPIRLTHPPGSES